MDFRRQRYFLAVAQHEGFRKAAEALCISQPALSQQIHALEEDLGAVLFDRDGRRVRMTAAGEEYFRGVEVVLNEMQYWSRRARDAHDGWINTLTVGVNTMMLLSYLPPIILGFRAAHPEVKLNVGVASPRLFERELLDRHVDIAITAHELSKEEIVSEPLWRFPIQIALPIGHPQSAGDAIDLRTLQDETLIVPARSPVFNADRVQELCRTHGLQPFRIQEVVGERAWLTIMGLVACGLGIAFMPSGYQHVLPTRVAFRPAVQLRPEVALTACYRRADTSLLIRKFIDFAREFAMEELHDIAPASQIA